MGTVDTLRGYCHRVVPRVQRNSSGSSRVRSWTMYHPGSVGRSVRAGICRPLMAVAASETVILCPLYFGLSAPVRAACLNMPPSQANVIATRVVQRRLSGIRDPATLTHGTGAAAPAPRPTPHTPSHDGRRPDTERGVQKQW